jgi:hypothetical protein
MSKRYESALVTATLCLALSVALSQPTSAEDKDVSPEYVIAEHIKSIGAPETLAKIKSRGFAGTASVDFIQGATGKVTGGQFMLVCEGRRLAIIMRYQDLEYPGEYFAFDGKEVTGGHIKPGQRSPLADFVYRYNG